MGNTDLVPVIFGTIIIMVFAKIYPKKAIQTWVLFAGAIGIPVLIVRESHLMFSELFLAPLLLLWLSKKKLGLPLINLSILSDCRTKIEGPIWAMCLAFSLSSFFNILFPNTAVAGEHTFLIGKLMGLFLYLASILTALLVGDLIDSFDDIRKICILSIVLGIFTLLVQQQSEDSTFFFLHSFQEHVGWRWMNVTILFSFSLSYMLFHPRFTKRLQTFIVAILLGIQIFGAYFAGTAEYKAVLVANFVAMVTVFCFKSKGKAVLILAISTLVFLSSIQIFENYVKEEEDIGSWGQARSSRLTIWYHSLLMFKDRPLLGVGPYNYYDYSIFLAGKRGDEDKRVGQGVMTSPHSQYLQILSETGAIGAIAFLWFLIEVAKLIFFFLNSAYDYRIKIVSSALAAILISRLFVGLLGDYIIPQYHNGGLQNFCSTVYFWICLGLLIGLKRIVMAEEKSLGTKGRFLKRL